MNPMMLELLKQLLTSQAGGFGMPFAGAGTSGPLNQVFGQVQDFMNSEKQSEANKRLNLDPLRDIAPFRVNAFRGYLAQHGGEVSERNGISALPMSFLFPSEGVVPGGPIMGRVLNQMATNAAQNMKNGGMAGNLPALPASFQLDTMNNTPSNVPGGAGGKYDLSQLALQQNDAFSIPKIQPFVDPTFGQKLFDQNARLPIMKDGGYIQTLIVEDDENTKEYLKSVKFWNEGDGIDNRLVYLPIQYKNGGPVKICGVEKAFLGKLIKGIGKGIGKVGEGIWQGLKGVADWQLGLIGAPDLIDNTFVDRSKALSKINNVGGTLFRTAADFVIPGLGTGIGMAGGLLNQLGQPRQDPSQGGMSAPGMGGFNPGMFSAGYTPTTGSLFDRINQGGIQTPVVPQYQMPYQMGPFMGFNPQNLFGTAQLPVGQGNIMVPGFAGGMFSLPRGMRYGGALKSFQQGGVASMMPLIPIQTEKVGKQPEMIIHLDGSITSVNATKRHAQMDDDEVTDIVPEGSYIASADKSMKIDYDKAEDIVIGIKSRPYKEMMKGKVPEEVTLASLWPTGDKKPKTPAELVKLLQKKIPVMDMENVDFEADIFTEETNATNLKSRIPFLTEIVRLNEEKRVKKEGVNTGVVASYKHGGPLRLPGVPHAQFGQTLGTIMELLPAALPAISSIFGGARQNRQGVGGISPMVSTGILGTIPMYQYGVMQNIGAQSNALNQGIEDFSSLGNQLIQNARQSSDIQLAASQQGVDFALQGQDALGRSALGASGLGALGAFMTPIEQERLNLGAARSRINNYRPISASRAAVDAMATPQVDMQALAAMGPRAAPLIAQMESDRMRAANQAAMQRNQILDQAEQNRIAQLNQLDQQEALFNINQGSREQDLMRARNAQAIGSLQQGIQQAGGIEANKFGIQGQGVQRAADIQSGLLGQMGQIQSQILPITTQFAMQNAQLAGQPLMLGSQNALNAFTTLGGMQSQNALAQQLPPELGGALPPPTGPYDSLGNFFRFLGSEMRGGQGMQALPSLPSLPMPSSVTSQTGGLGNAGIPAGVMNIGGTNVPYIGPQIQPVQSQSQTNPFCRNGVHMITGQPC